MALRTDMILITRNTQRPGDDDAEELWWDTLCHIGHVEEGLRFIKTRLEEAGKLHDADKLGNFELFQRSFASNFKDDNRWHDFHVKNSRHHLTATSGVPSDVNLVDVIEYVVDCVVAAMARKGEVTTPIELPVWVLHKALANTVQLLKDNVRLRT